MKQETFTKEIKQRNLINKKVKKVWTAAFQLLSFFIDWFS